MLAKPLKIAGATALPTNSPKPEWRRDGGTACVMRTQGSGQAVGGFALPQRLIQPRKQRSVEADRVTSGGRQHLYERDGEFVQAPPGSIKIVARSQRSVKDELPVPIGRTGAPRPRETLPPVLPLGWAVCLQLEEVAVGCGKESDSPIVVRDGRADHMAKGWAGRQREHSTHRGNCMLPVAVSSTLLAIAAKVWFNDPEPEPSARLPEEPCAGKPHAGICEGGAR